MEEVVKKEKVENISCDVFCNKYVTNKHYRFHLNKKYGKESLTEKKWIEICKKERIEIKSV